MAAKTKSKKNERKHRPKGKKVTTAKRKYFNYTQDTLLQAVDDVAKGASLKATSRKFGVPFSTLKDKVTKKTAFGAKSGPGTVLSQNEEKKLVEWIILMGKNGFPPTKEVIATSVKLLLESLKKKNPFPKGKPGRHWFEGFLKRHPEISLRTPQNLNRRRSDVNERQIRGWFEEVQDYLKTKVLLDIDPRRVFNLDESCFFLNPKGDKVYAKKSSKSVHAKVGADDKECLTVLITGNAAGELAPPMVMFKYKRLPLNIVQRVPDGWGVRKSDSGWMTSETFYEYITNIFHPWCLRSGIEFPILVFMDGHASHLNLTLSDFCVQNSIELVSLFPNSTQWTQPLDVGLFRSLKDAWKKTIVDWRLNHNGSALQKKDFSAVLKIALDSLDLKTILPNSFRKCGLSPFSAEAIDYSQFITEGAERESESTATENSLSSPEDVDAMKKHMQYIEKSISSEVLQLFKIDRDRDGNWHGSLEYKQLFEFWLKCSKMLSKGQVESNGMQELVVNKENAVRDNNFNVVLSSATTSALGVIDESIIVEEINSDSMQANKDNLDNSVRDVVVYKVTDTILDNQNQTIASDLSVCKEKNKEGVESITNTVECVLTSTEKTKSVHTINHSISEPILNSKNENSCPNKQAVTNKDYISSVFKNTLFYPNKHLQINNDVKKKRKEKLPAVATSNAWRKWKQETDKKKEKS